MRLYRTFLASGALALALLATPVLAQPSGGDPSGQNPTADAPTEQQLLKALQGGRISGRITILDSKAAVLEQPQGREYQKYHEAWLPWIGGIAIIGMVLALAAFYFTRGRITLEDSPQSGQKILRFSFLERLNHWMTATAFILLAITGLNYIFGKRLIFPLIGPDAFAVWSQSAKYVHDFMAWAFMFGLLFMIVVWIKGNLPDRTDIRWLREFGGFVGKRHPPAGRFNTGQKMIFWSVVIGGLALSVTGVMMLFPFSTLDIKGMQTAQYIHATAGVLLIAVIIAHIYIGTLGMEGAYKAMSSGKVDLAWAKAHHSLWVAEEQAKTAKNLPLRSGMTPAE